MRFKAGPLIILAVSILSLLFAPRAARAQGNQEPCPDASSSTLEFTVQSPGQSTTVPINLKPCEIITVAEQHDMHGDGNLGTNVTLTYMNNSGQPIYSQEFWGFYTRFNHFPQDSSQPFPWRGTVGPEALPVSLKIEAHPTIVGFGSGQQPEYPKYKFTISKSPRPEYNKGGNNFGNALSVPAFPSTYYGSLRPEEQGQFFKVRLPGNARLYFDGYCEGRTSVGANYHIDIYNDSLVDLTPHGPFIYPSCYGLNTYSKSFDNPFASATDYYIRVTALNFTVLNFKMVLSLAPIVRETPLIFVPGISGSQLVDRTTNTEHWPGVFRSHNPLSLNPDDNPNPNIVATDVIRSISVLGHEEQFYGPLIDALRNNGGYREYMVAHDPDRRTAAGCDTTQRAWNPTLFVFAYDWRKSNVENAQALKDYVRCVEQFHPGQKVNILAHSMGGLVSRRYILSDPGKTNRLITIATPFVGAPKGIYTLETGDAGLPRILIWKSTLRRLAEFFPGVHELVPSRSYFDLGGRPFRERGDFNRNGVRDETYTYGQLVDLLNSRHDPRSAPGTAGQVFHDYPGQDDWRNDQTGVKYDHIIGEKSKNDTIGQVVGRRLAVCRWPRCPGYDTFDVKMIQGDGTVPKRSATRLSSTLDLNAPNATRYYYSRSFTNQPDEMYEHTGITHNPLVHAMVLYLLGRGPEPSYQDIYDVPGTEDSNTPTPPTAQNTSYYMNVTGVDYVAVTDAAGNTNTKIDDKFAAAVPEVTYRPLGDKAVMVSMPADQTYTVRFDQGPDPVAVEVVKGPTNKEPIEVVRYTDVDVPQGVKVQIQTTAAGITDLRYDANNDGVYETVVQPTASLSGEAAKDVTPPEVTFAATQQGPSATVTLGAQDDNSGLKALYYSLDGENYQTYTTALSVNPTQTPKVYVFADDNAANRSNLQTFAVPRRSALLVVGALPLAVTDGFVKTRMEDLGYAVTVVDAASSAASDAAGRNVVVISSTVSPADVNTKFRDVATPVLTWDNELFDDLGMSGSTAGTDFGVEASQTSAAISDATHPLAAGLSGTQSVVGLPGGFTWAAPNASAHKVATVPGAANKALVFGYDAGAAMPGLNAPARRAGLFLSDDTPERLNSNGWALFDAAVNWAAGALNSAPSVSITSPSEGQFFNPNANITINADASDSDGSVVKVDFYAGSTLVGTATAGNPFSVTWNNVQAGEYSLTAVATDELGGSTTSAPVNITVNVSSGVIAGRVTRASDSTAIAGASVKVYSGPTLISTRSTDGAGDYSAEGLDPGIYTVECSAEGFEPQGQGGVVVVNGASTTVNFSLGFALPVINSIAPTVGPVGTSVTITGSNFASTASGNQVKFNGTSATVSAASNTSLTVAVPSGATSGRLTVTSSSGTSMSEVDFFVPPSSYSASDVESTGRMAIGGSKTVTINTANKVGLVVFEGTAGQRVSLKVTGHSLTGGNGYLDLYIKKPDGTTLTSKNYIGSGGGFVDVATLPSSGSYTILVDPQTTNVGSTTFTLYDVPADPTGGITPGGSAVTLTTTAPGQNTSLTFSGAANQRVSLKVSGVAITGGNGYLDVQLKRPNGTTLAYENYISSSGFMDVQTLPTAGTYTIFVDPHISGTGSATLTLYDVPADASSGITPGGAAVTLTTTVPGQNAQATFEGTAGQRVSLRLTGVSLTGGNGYLDASIKKPDGTNLASENYISGSGFIDLKTLPVAGTYKVFINPQVANVGSATLTLYDVPADVTGTLTPGVPLTVTTTAPGQNAAPTFEGTAGQRVSLKITGVTTSGGTGYLDVYLKKPDGTTLASLTYVSSSGFIDVQTLPATGTYTVLVNPQTSTTGSATLTLYDVPADLTGALTVDAAAVDVATTIPGHNARLTFDGTAGQQRTVRLTNNTYSQVVVKLLKPDGSVLTSYTSYGSGSFNLSTQTLPATGAYTVLVDPVGSNTGGISVSVTSSSGGLLQRVFDFYRSFVA